MKYLGILTVAVLMALFTGEIKADQKETICEVKYPRFILEKGLAPCSENNILYFETYKWLRPTWDKNISAMYKICKEGTIDVFMDSFAKQTISCRLKAEENFNEVIDWTKANQ